MLTPGSPSKPEREPMFTGRIRLPSSQAGPHG